MCQKRDCNRNQCFWGTKSTTLKTSLLESTYCHGWAVFAHTAVQDDVEVVIGWIQKPTDNTDNGKGLQIHIKNRDLGERMRNQCLQCENSCYVVSHVSRGAGKGQGWSPLACFIRWGEVRKDSCACWHLHCNLFWHVYGWLVAIAVFTFIYLFHSLFVLREEEESKRQTSTY